jgi:hypothetical protein
MNENENETKNTTVTRLITFIDEFPIKMIRIVNIVDVAWHSG